MNDASLMFHYSDIICLIIDVQVHNMHKLVLLILS
jgi:hypothetical protein